MPGISRGLSLRPQLLRATCPQCSRTLTSGSSLLSGHNKWSKIKHDKAAADAKKNAVRTQFTKFLTLYSRLYGANPDNNPQLAAALASARKAGVPKAIIEAAVARGQGRSSEGAALESVTFEAIIPPSVALIVETETDSRLRLLQDLNLIIKKGKGTPGTSKFFFSRLGRVVFEKNESGIGAEQIMDEALEAGAEDLEDDEEGNIVVWTQPNHTSQVCRSVATAFGLKAISSDIIWSPNEDTKVSIDSSPQVADLADLLVKLQEHPDVQAVYSNVSRGTMSDDEWAALEENLDA